MNKRSILVLGLLLLVALMGSAQDEEGEQQAADQTIEELYLSQDIELQIIRGQALSNDREMKLLALQSIRSMVEEGSLSEDNPGLFTVLEALATEGTARQVRSGDPGNVEARAAARYWPRMMGPDFRRDRAADGVNALLNYGYSVLRSGTDRKSVV